MSLPLPVPGPLLPAEALVTPELVSAAYRRALRFGTFWRLRPEERAVLILARRLKAVKSPVLRGVILKILERVWPSRAMAIRAVEEGLKVLRRKIQLALKIGAVHVARTLAEAGLHLIKQLGYSHLNTPPYYRGEAWARSTRELRTRAVRA